MITTLRAGRDSLPVKSSMSRSPFFAYVHEYVLFELILTLVRIGLRSKLVKCEVSKKRVQYGSPTPHAPRIFERTSLLSIIIPVDVFTTNEAGSLIPKIKELPVSKYIESCAP